MTKRTHLKKVVSDYRTARYSACCPFLAHTEVESGVYVTFLTWHKICLIKLVGYNVQLNWRR